MTVGMIAAASTSGPAEAAAAVPPRPPRPPRPSSSQIFPFNSALRPLSIRTGTKLEEKRSKRGKKSFRGHGGKERKRRDKIDG